MTTLDELGELWCALWMKELEKERTEERSGNAADGWMRLTGDDRLLLSYREVGSNAPRSVYLLEFSDDTIRLPDFDITVGDGILCGSLSVYDMATAANPWDAAAEKLRELLEAA